MAISANRKATQKRVRIAVFGYEGCSAWSAAGILELFAIANLCEGATGSRHIFDCVTIGERRGTIRASQGVRLPTIIPGRRRYDAVIVPPLWYTSLEDLNRRFAAAQNFAPFLQRMARKSRITASACSGAVLLAQAGLLTGRRATTCWWLVKWFEERFPDVQMDAGKLVVADRGLWTAAAGTAYIHLCLELVKEFAGAETAALTARLALVEPCRGSQSPFLGRDLLRPPDGAGLAERAARSIEARLASGLSIRNLALQLNTTERTLHRRFIAAFGVPPLVYLQSRRIALAKQLLEMHDEPLERIIERCGYRDVSSFRKLFVREVGMTPREYRLRFHRSPSVPGE